jgi:hypothetical protein
VVRSTHRALSVFFVPLLLIPIAGLTACRKKEQPAAAATPVATQKPGMAMEGGKEMPAVPAGSVRLSADRQQFLGVVLIPVNKRSLAREVRTVGRVEYDERKLAFVNTKFAGWIERLDVDFTGVYVRKGQTLMSIYSPDLVSAQELPWIETSLPAADRFGV